MQEDPLKLFKRSIYSYRAVGVYSNKAVMCTLIVDSIGISVLIHVILVSV